MHQQASNDHRPMPLFSQTQQAELDNEVSFIFSQSFLKDSLIMPPQGNAGAKLIDAVIANQINPEHGTKAAPGTSQVHNYVAVRRTQGYVAAGAAQGATTRDEVVTIEYGPPDHGRPPPPMEPEKVIMFNQHTESIISKNSSSLSESGGGPLYGHMPVSVAPLERVPHTGGNASPSELATASPCTSPDAQKSEEEEQSVTRNPQQQHVGLSALDYIVGGRLIPDELDTYSKGGCGGDYVQRQPSELPLSECGPAGPGPGQPSASTGIPRPDRLGKKFRPRSVSPSDAGPPALPSLPHHHNQQQHDDVCRRELESVSSPPPPPLPQLFPTTYARLRTLRQFPLWHPYSI